MTLPVIANWIWNAYGKDITDKAFGAVKDRWVRFTWDDAATKYRQRLKDIYSSTKILGHPKEIFLEETFTDVFVLDKLSAIRRFDIDRLQRVTSAKEIYQNSEDRRGALRIAIEKERLFILGKPGAGKTTFMRYLTLKAIEGKIQKVPIFISLKEWNDSNLELMNFIENQFEICEFPNAFQFIDHILKKGDSIVLFDGLDEINQEGQQRSKSITTINNFVKKYPNNRYAITCRVATTDYSFDKFTYVEIADFDEKQIRVFVKKWFSNEAKRNKFIQELETPENYGIRELASTPLLLTLLCLTYEETGEFPQRKVELYKEALEALLVKWDSARNISRDMIYRQLSLTRKRQMFARIAAEGFQEGRYFFEKDYLSEKIKNYLLRLPPAEGTIPGEIDGDNILRSIASQHGIFVERAHRIFSFSHLTFQEYFTASYIVDNMTNGSLERMFDKHVFSDQWREVVFMVVSLLDDAEYFFELMKKSIDRLSKGDELLIQKIKRAYQFMNYEKEKEKGKFEAKEEKRLGDYKIYRKIRAFSYVIINDMTPHLSYTIAPSAQIKDEFIVDFKKSFSMAASHLGHKTETSASPLRQSLGGLYNLVKGLERNLEVAQLIIKAYNETLQLAARFDTENIYFEQKNYRLFVSREIERRILNAKTELENFLQAIEKDLSNLKSHYINIDILRSLEMLSLDANEVINGINRQIDDAIQFSRQISIYDKPADQDWKFEIKKAETQYEFVRANQLLVDCLDLAYVRDRNAILDAFLLHK